MTTPQQGVLLPGYLTGLKTMVVESLQRIFDAEYEDSDFRNIYISLDYPTDEHNFPSIWVDYEDVQDLQTAGIGHQEYGEPNEKGERRKFKRWRYGGFLSLTVVAQTSLERDRLCDQLIALIAFGDEDSNTSEFRQYIDNNEFIACNLDWDRVKVTATAANSGTPYGLADLLYERTIALSVFGEFFSEGTTRSIVPLSQVVVTPYAEGIEEQPPGDPTQGWM